MLLIIALSMSLVVSLCSATDCITAVLTREWEQCRLEDGSFETYVPLSRRNMTELSELNLAVEKMFYVDLPAGEISTLRIFSNRSSINLPYVEEGELPTRERELFVEKLFAANHRLHVGDTISLGGEEFIISGIGCLPDYAYVKQNGSDVSANEEFSVGIVKDSALERLSRGQSVIYHYAYRLQGCTEKELKEKLTKLTFDPNSVKDTYLRKQVATADNLKESFQTGSRQLKLGALSLAEGLRRLEGGALFYEGAMRLYDGLDEMERSIEPFLAESTEVKLVNLSSFQEESTNIRIHNPVDDAQVGKQSALVAGIFLLLLLVYMLSVFASGTVERERSVIGTLYALGYEKKEILSHYMIVPMLITGVGTVVGMISGFLLTGAMASSYAAMYSFPALRQVFPLYLFAYGMGMPLILAYGINRLTLSKKLGETPLAMMHESGSSGGGLTLRLDRFSFGTKYIIRQFFREIKGNLTLLAGLMVSIMILMFSFACYGSIKNYSESVADDVHFQYLYLLRNPVNDLPKNVSVGYSRGFFLDFPMTGTEMEVTLLGIGAANPYFSFASDLGDDVQTVAMSSSARIKFGYHVGDRVVFRDNSEDRLYAFEIDREVPYGNGLYFFMELDTMRKAFNLPDRDLKNLEPGERVPKHEDFYYNTVFSDRPLTFRHNMQLGMLARSEMKAGADKFITLMWNMILMLVGVSVIIFMASLYLLMKSEIDRSSFSISLLKALGYSEKTVYSFYLDGSFFMTVAALIVGLPLCKWIVDLAYPFCVSNVNAGFEASVSPFHYGCIIVITLLSYGLTRKMLCRYLRKIQLTEILKNRE